MFFIAGAFKHFKILSLYIIKHKLKNINVYDGVDNLKWNGGRVNLLYSADFSERQLKFYNDRKIGVYFTFSNSEIDLTDKNCLSLLDKINNPLNGVILVNDDLRKFLRNNYPDLKLMYSCTGFKNSDINISYLKKLETQYDLICPRFEWVFDPVFYKNINPNKYEIMVNDTCIYKCPKWHEHFEAINTANRNCITDREEANKIQECWVKGFDPNIESKNPMKSGMDLTKSNILQAKKIGYKHFKISGREMNEADFLDELRKCQD